MTLVRAKGMEYGAEMLEMPPSSELVWRVHGKLQQQHYGCSQGLRLGFFGFLEAMALT